MHVETTLVRRQLSQGLQDYSRSFISEKGFVYLFFFFLFNFSGGAPGSPVVEASAFGSDGHL